MSSLFIHSARQLITLRGGPGPRRGAALGQLNIINDGALLIEDGLIREVGPTRRIENLSAAKKANEISAAGRVVMPGFVDSHTHLISGPSRLTQSGSRPLRSSSKDVTMALVNTPFVRDATARRLSSDALSVLKECAAYGTTTIEAKSGYGLSASAELKILRVLTALGDLPITVVPTFAVKLLPPEFEGQPVAYIDWVCRELLPNVHKRGLARFVDIACDHGAFRAHEIRPAFDTARQMGLPLKMHLAQFGAEMPGTIAGDYRLTSIDHLNHIHESEVYRIAESGAIATLTPASTFFLGQQYAPARALIDCGTPVALATNYSRVTSPTHNMQMAIFLACQELQMTPAEAISAATINGACALELGHRAGSLEVGKQADIILLKVGDHRELAHEFGVNLVDMTLKQGVPVNPEVKWSVAS